MVGTFAALLVTALPVSAQTAGGWPQFQGGPEHTGVAPDGPAPGYSVDWTLAVAPGGPGDQYGLSAPVSAGDLIVAVGPEAVIGVDAAAGTQSWSVDRDLGPSVPAAITSIGGRDAVVYTEGFGEGPPDAAGSASPSASASGSASPSPSSTGGGTQDEPFDSHLAAFDLETQEPLWDTVELDAVSRTGVTVGDGMAYLGVNGGTIYAVDLAKGKVAWTAELGRPVATQPAFTDGTVVVGLQASREEPHPTVVALDASTGEERWRADDQSQAAIVSTASIADGTVYVAFTGGQESSIDAFALDTGGRRWRTRFPRFFDLTASTPPVVTDDAVYVTDAQGETYRLDPATGTRVWEFALNEGVLRTAPIAVGDHVLVGTIDGSLVALEASGGDLVWRDDGDGSPLRALAVAGDRVIAVRAGAGAGLVAFAHDDDVALVREVSPTTLNLGLLLGAFAVAALVVAGIVLLAGRVLAGRMGPAFPNGEDRLDFADEDEYEDDDDIDEDDDDDEDEDEADDDDGDPAHDDHDEDDR
ncbi:MAG TPA: PQQ-binding-like beta-propeller repeat protein [Actinomycetota bacterium]|nr:PQQ-binding-like beta-propeller repeat protein [Actinomycetota bacterium]